jgi:DNA-directed RNA polymerase alpha subunit
MEQKVLNGILQDIIAGIKAAQNSIRIPGAAIIPEDTDLHIHVELSSHSYVRSSFDIPVRISARREPDAAEDHPQSEILSRNIRDTDLPTRIKNALSYRDIKTVRGMVNIPNGDYLLGCRSIGRGGVSQAEAWLESHGLSFGMFNQ